MNTLDSQAPQPQRSWVRPQLSELDVSIQTKGGRFDYHTEYSFTFRGFTIPITNDSNSDS
jgi:hypothetical protein